MAAVLVAGSNGEAASLEPEERALLVGAVRAALPTDVVLLAGSGAPSACQAARLTRIVLDAGADGVLVLSPQQSPDARRYYETVAGAADGATVLAYHFPAASPPGLPVAVLPELPVAGLKDSSGDLRRLYDELDTFPGVAVHGFGEPGPRGGGARVRGGDSRDRQPGAGALPPRPLRARARPREGSCRRQTPWRARGPAG